MRVFIDATVQLNDEAEQAIRRQIEWDATAIPRNGDGFDLEDFLIDQDSEDFKGLIWEVFSVSWGKVGTEVAVTIYLVNEFDVGYSLK